jgi:hypothetical protein
MDTVPIRPRYYEHDTAPLVVGTASSGQNPPQTPAVQVPAVQTAAAQAAAPASKGIFTSIYDNKIIVLIVVIIIIIIALFAYVIYRKDDPEPPKPRPRRNSGPPQDNIASTGSNGGGNGGSNAGTGTGSNAGADNTGSGNSTAGGAGTNNNTGGGAGSNNANSNTAKTGGVTGSASTQSQQENLQKLLERGRAAIAEPAQETNDEPEFDDEKAEQEILELMVGSEDDGGDDGGDDEDADRDTTGATPVVGTSVEGRGQDASHDSPLTTPTSELHTSGPSTTSTPGAIAASINTPPITFDPARCQTLVKNHQCKNKPGPGGKCGVHSK